MKEEKYMPLRPKPSKAKNLGTRKRSAKRKKLSRQTERLPAAIQFSLLVIVLPLFQLTGCGGASQRSNIQPPPPAFTLLSSPASIAVQQNASGSSTITVNATGGFSGSVNLVASGFPGGVNAVLNPASTTSQSTLTLTVTGSASPGTSTITITGTSGNLAPTTQLTLTVLVPPPPGSVPASFLALNNVDPTDNPATDGMFYGAVGHPIRLAWPYIETSRGVFDFSFYDEYAAVAPKDPTNNTVAMLDLTLGMTPGWAIADQSTCRALTGGVIGCQAPPDNLEDWKDFITALIQHYNGSTAPHIKYYEIWNEWNTVDPNNGFWSGTPTQLVALQTSACTIIHAADPQSLVVTPSTVGVATTSSSSAPAALAGYFSAGGTSCPGSTNSLIDAVSFHGNVGLMTLSPYPLPGEDCTQPGCNGTIIQITNSYRGVMNLNSLQSTPLLDTEGGFESANITDPDQRAAWLAQFYALQGGLFNSDQLQWVSWFTWGAPGVAGNIETANNTPDEAGVAYNQLFDWLFGRFPSACTQSGTVWTCPLTGSSGYQAQIIWDDSQTCNNGTCTTGPQIAPSWAIQMRDTAGNLTPVTGGSPVPVGLKPIILEN
jgi:hypothetical protein